MPQLDMILQMLKADLTASKTLLPQVITAINDQYSYPASRLPAFFSEKYPQLEDYEVDLLFSPQYTPAEHNRLEYIPMLGEKALSLQQLATLKQSLLDEQLAVLLRTPDEQVECNVPLHEVFIERYVNLMKLDQPLPPGVYAAICQDVPEASRNEANLMARDHVWATPERTAMLLAFLKAFKHRHSFSTGKISFLTNFVRTYRPSSMADLDRQFESLIESCKRDMENADTRGFHDPELKELNSDNKLAQPNAGDVVTNYQHMIDMAEALLVDYRQIPVPTA